MEKVLTWAVLEGWESILTWQQMILPDFFSIFLEWWVIIGLWVELIIFWVLAFLYKNYRKSSFVVFFEMFFEKVFDFFEDILGKEEKRWTKVYITSLFFIILLSNLLGLFLEFLVPMFGYVKEWSTLALLHPHLIWEAIVEHYIKIPTADINFNIAMAVVWVVIVIYEQFMALWFWKTIYEYVPIFWKNYIPYERGHMNKYIDFPLYLLVKVFDIIISLFLGMLEIIGHAAKVISLSFRLFWNVTSWGILLGMLVWAMWALTTSLFSFEFPVVWLLILYLQEMLVAFIQALVFPLLIAIFIKVAKVH